MLYVPLSGRSSKSIIINITCLVCGVIIGVSVMFQKSRLLDAIINQSLVKGHNIELSPMKDKERHSEDQTAVAEELAQHVRIFCIVLTSPENHDKKAVHILATWGRRCNKIFFASESTNHTTLPILKVNVTHGRDHLTMKTMTMFDALYENNLNDYDWFLKADDDTYVILENLRYFLSSHSPTEPVFFGHRFKTLLKQGFHSGGAGYVISQEALRRFGTRTRNTASCKNDGGAEDLEFGRCLESLGVKTGHSLDNLNRSRFHCFTPSHHIMGNYGDWYYKYDANGALKGIGNISEYAITFHYITPTELYTIEFFVYHLRTYGIIHGLQNLN